MNVLNLKVKIFADGADKAAMLELCAKPRITGFTTNPKLMRKAVIRDYAAFERDIPTAIRDRAISLEVFADEFSAMEGRAHFTASWADNIYVKIPVTPTAQPHSDCQ